MLDKEPIDARLTISLINVMHLFGIHFLSAFENFGKQYILKIFAVDRAKQSRSQSVD